MSEKSPETGFQKVLKYAIPATVGIAIFMLWATIVSFVKTALQDTFTTIVFAAADILLLYLLWYVYQNYGFLTRWLSDQFIQYSPVFFVRKAIFTLKEKRNNVGKQVEILNGGKQGVDRQIAKMKSDIAQNGKLGVSAMKQNNADAASMYGGMVASDQKDLESLLELQQLSANSLLKLRKIYDYWGYTIQGLEHDADRKEQQWEIVKPLVKGLRSADEFINSNSKTVQEYGLGMKSLEEKISQSLGYADEFDRKSKGVIEGIDIEKGALQLDGLKALERFMDDKSLLLPIPKLDVKDDFNSNISQIGSGSHLKLLQ